MSSPLRNSPRIIKREVKVTTALRMDRYKVPTVSTYDAHFMFSDPTCAAVDPEDKEEEFSVSESEGEGAEATEAQAPRRPVVMKTVKTRSCPRRIEIKTVVIIREAKGGALVVFQEDDNGSSVVAE
ncbi:hypothetical protein PC123_g21383 [Phytophthora cactorum]|nr:hypothetical protein PC123_g21383 [Phytophthora cactorum]